jgi:hypothetical protein
LEVAMKNDIIAKFPASIRVIVLVEFVYSTVGARAATTQVVVEVTPPAPVSSVEAANTDYALAETNSNAIVTSSAATAGTTLGAVIPGLKVTPTVLAPVSTTTVPVTPTTPPSGPSGTVAESSSNKGLFALLVLLLIPVIAGIGIGVWFLKKGGDKKVADVQEHKKQSKKSSSDASADKRAKGYPHQEGEV